MTYPPDIPENEILQTEASLVTRGFAKWDKDGVLKATSLGQDVLEAFMLLDAYNKKHNRIN